MSDSVVGNYFRGFKRFDHERDTELYYCESHDHAGYNLVMIGGDRPITNVSERAIGRTIHPLQAKPSLHRDILDLIRFSKRAKHIAQLLACYGEVFSNENCRIWGFDIILKQDVLAVAIDRLSYLTRTEGCDEGETKEQAEEAAKEFDQRR